MSREEKTAPPLRMARPSIGGAELARVSEVFASGWLGEGPVVAALETRLCRFTGSAHAVAVNTGTSALHLALVALGIGAGDEVILPAFTFLADPMAVILAGASPVFADVDPETFDLSPQRVEERLTPRTRAVLPTDFAGLPADTQSLRAVVGPEIGIVRDAAHSFGSLVRDRPVGTWLGEDVTCFSFDPLKNLTCGEGGALLVEDPHLAQALRTKRNLGRASGAAGSLELGFRYHMSDINAAIGLAQMERFDELARARRRVARGYDRLLAGRAGIAVPSRDWDALVPFMYVVRVLDGRRDALGAFLRCHGIHADLRYPPAHQHALFAHDGAPLPVTERLGRECLSLPLYPSLSEADATRVVETMDAFFRGEG
jgi:dTDP-4-amino-4,6-dideoxygalactose transaminase